MKKIFLILINFAICTWCNAQIKDSLKNLANNTNSDKVAAMAANKPGSEMPIFNIMQFDSSRYNTRDIDKNKNVLLVLFNPGCGHCMDFTKMVLANLDSFKNTQFVFVSGDKTFPYMAEFIKNVEYKKIPQVIIGIDLDYITPTIFAYEGIPQIMIYGRDKKLIDIIYKQTTIKKLRTIFKRSKNDLQFSVDSPPQKIIENKVSKELRIPIDGLKQKIEETPKSKKKLSWLKRK